MISSEDRSLPSHYFVASRDPDKRGQSDSDRRNGRNGRREDRPPLCGSLFILLFCFLLLFSVFCFCFVFLLFLSYCFVFFVASSKPCTRFEHTAGYRYYVFPWSQGQKGGQLEVWRAFCVVLSCIFMEELSYNCYTNLFEPCRVLPWDVSSVSSVCLSVCLSRPL